MNRVICLATLLLAALPASAVQARHRPLTPDEARQIAALVAAHDHIDLNDTRIELDSMDAGAEFIPGFASFIVIRESNSPGPDQTLRRYAVNLNTGNVWEMTLCSLYNFPELAGMQRSLTGRTPQPGSPVTLAEQKRLGCGAKPGRSPGL